MSRSGPGEVEHSAFYRSHLGPRFESAGLRVQFHRNRGGGIQLKAQVSEEYRAAIFKGLQDGLELHFPDLPPTTSVWITEVTEHEVESSPAAFYIAARLVIEQAASLPRLRLQQNAS